eukprot:Gb_00293 [translate_table: standard]
MQLLQHHNRIIQPIPPPALRVFVLRPDHVSELGKTPEKEDIGVDVDPAILVQSGKAKDVGQILSQRNLARIDVALLQFHQPLLCRGIVEEEAKVRSGCHDSKSPPCKRPEDISALWRVQCAGYYEHACEWMVFEDALEGEALSMAKGFGGRNPCHEKSLLAGRLPSEEEGLGPCGELCGDRIRVEDFEGEPILL